MSVIKLLTNIQQLLGLLSERPDGNDAAAERRCLSGASAPNDATLSPAAAGGRSASH